LRKDHQRSLVHEALIQGMIRNLLHTASDFIAVPGTPLSVTSSRIGASKHNN